MNLDNVVKTVDFGVLVPIEINPDNKIISPPIRPFQSVNMFDVAGTVSGLEIPMA